MDGKFGCRFLNGVALIEPTRWKSSDTLIRKGRSHGKTLVELIAKKPNLERLCLENSG